MTFDDVDPFEMEPRGHHEIDDAAADELLAGRGYDIDPALADVLGDVRVAFGSRSPEARPALVELMSGNLEPTSPRGIVRMRTRFAARLATATSLAVIATGSLAVAGALPGPAQNTAERVAAAVGLDIATEKSNAPHGKSDEHRRGPRNDSTSERTDGTQRANPNTPASGPHDNHGAEVSAVAQDHTVVGCEHGRAVSEVASGETNEQACPTPTTPSSSPPTAATDTTTTADDEDAGEAGPPPGLPVQPTVPTVPTPPPAKPAEPGSGPPASTPVTTHPSPDGHAQNG
jgi:hypothetical protein